MKMICMLYILNINITSLSSNVITLEVDLRFPCYLPVLPSFKIGDIPKGGKFFFLSIPRRSSSFF